MNHSFTDGPTYDPVFYYYHSDHLGSASVMTNRDGDVVQHYGYHAFGNERYKHNTQAFSVTNRYTGQQVDEDTGLYFYGSRYYDLALARFTQADTIVPDSSTSQALNRYAYVKNNPLKFTDPSGHGWLKKLIGKISGAVNNTKLLGRTLFGSDGWGATVGGMLGPLRPYVGLAVTIGLCAVPGLAGTPLPWMIGAAVQGWVNGGTFEQVALSAGLGFASGMIAPGGGNILHIGTTNALTGAITGAASGAITSAVYGQNVEKSLAMGAAWGAGMYVAKERYMEWVKGKLTQKIKRHAIDQLKKYTAPLEEIAEDYKSQGEGSNWSVYYNIKLTGLDVQYEATGFGSDILNSKGVKTTIITAMKEGIMDKFPLEGSTGSCESKWDLPLMGSFTVEANPIQVNIYSGADIIFGNIQFAPDTLHGNLTTVELKGKISVFGAGVLRRCKTEK